MILLIGMSKRKKKKDVIQVWTLPDFFSGIAALKDLLSSMQFKWICFYSKKLKKRQLPLVKRREESESSEDSAQTQILVTDKS